MEKRSKKATVVATAALLFLASGCGISGLSEDAAKKRIVRKLSDKYGEEFEISSIEKVNVGQEFASFRYVADVQREGEGESFSAGMSVRGDNFYDSYEELLYKDKVEEEIESIPADETVFNIDDINYNYDVTYDEKCKDFEEYKKEGIVQVSIDVTLSGRSVDTSVDSLYEYADKINDLGYSFSIAFKYNGKNRILNCNKGTVDKDKLRGKIQFLMEG